VRRRVTQLSILLERVAMKLIPPLRVTRGLDPRVHLLRMEMDCRVKPGNDAAQMSAGSP
jgi:hypothetical protein